MTRRWRRSGTAALAAIAAIAAGCTGRGETPRTVDCVAYGTTSAPYHGRWWQDYERGVSWSLGGFWPQAESDLRRCLASRRTDSRRARTYGMHFVQCFAHRELGAVLIEEGRLDEAERELRISAGQEPSAKADFLLQRIAALRGGATAGPSASPARPGLVLERVVPADAGAGAVDVSGRLIGGATVLAAVADDGTRRLLTVAPNGAFAAALAANEQLVAEAPGASPVAMAPSVPPPAPRLTLDGPEDGRVVADARVFYRYDAAGAGGLAELVVDCDGKRVAERRLAGVQAGGTLALALEPGPHRLRFAVSDGAGATASAERSLSLSPRPAQDRRFRATALLVPLAAPRDGRQLEALDDPRLATAVQDDGRFRIIDGRADELARREAHLAEAGYVDRSTAADLGRRLSARYVLTGTLRRGRGDIECFMRLVQAESGRVIASADAYAEEADAEDQAFFALVAGRLRQAFPVLEGRVRHGDDGTELDLGRRDGVVVRMRFFALRPGEDTVDPASGRVLVTGAPVAEATLEADEVEGGATRMRVIAGTPPRSAEAVSE